MPNILSKKWLELREFLKKFILLRLLVRFAWKFFSRPLRFFTGFFSLLVEAISGRRQVISRREATFFGDHIATTHFVQFLHDSKFIHSYHDAFQNIPDHVKDPIKSLDISWRAHICTWAATQALTLEGDFVECGVWYGILSRTMCSYVDFNQLERKFYLFDTWGEQAGSHSSYKDDIFAVVKSRFSDFNNVHLVRGLVPDVLDKVKIEKIAYLSIDMNGSIAERLTLERFYEKVVPGGIIYFDDYGWEYPELRKTVDAFFSDKPESLLHFPSGNSIIVKL